MFAENVVFKGKKLRLNEAQNFEMLHDGLNTFAATEERSQVMLSMMENQSSANLVMGSSADRYTE